MISGSSHHALQKVQKLLKVNPKLTPLELVSGTESRSSIVNLDPKMHNQNYVSNIKKRATIEFNKHVLGSAFAMEALDAALQWFDEIEKWKSMIYDSSAGDSARPRQIVIATPSMHKRICKSTYPFSTDSVEGCCI